MDIDGKKSETPKNKNRITNIKCRLFTSTFWDGIATKLVESITSVKVWGLAAVTIVGTWLLINNFITGTNWATAITGVYGVIFGMREVFKISKVQEMARNGNSDKARDMSV